MPSKRVPSPKDIVKVRPRRQYQVGDEVMVPARETRVAGLGAVEAVTVELWVGQKVTANPDYLFGDVNRGLIRMPALPRRRGGLRDLFQPARRLRQGPGMRACWVGVPPCPAPALVPDLRIRSGNRQHPVPRLR